MPCLATSKKGNLRLPSYDRVTVRAAMSALCARVAMLHCAAHTLKRTRLFGADRCAFVVGIYVARMRFRSNFKNVSRKVLTEVSGPI